MFRRILFLALIYAIVLVHPVYAYIDPGTGSMLFSLVLCSVSSVYFLLSSLILKLKAKIFSEKSLAKTKHEFVIYSEGNQYYTVFKPVLDEFERRQIPVMYYTSSEDDDILLENYEFVNTKFIGKGNNAYFRLAFLRADVCLMTTPQLDVLQLKRSKNVKHYSHIFHSIGFSMLYRLFSLDYYDSVLCDADYQVEMIREIEQKRNLLAKELPVVGSTYIDFNTQRLPQRTSTKFTILIAPSWGPHSLLAKFGEKLLDEIIEKTDFEIVVRPHPQSLKVEKGLVDFLQNKYKGYDRLKWDFTSDNLLVMANSDVLISDFSGIMIDYAFLFKKSFIYIDTEINYEMYDFSDLEENIPYKHKIAELMGIKLNVDNGDMENIVEIIAQIKQDDNLQQVIEETCNKACFHRGQAAKNVVDFLVKTQQEISGKC